MGVGDRALRLPVIIDTDVDPNAARIRLPGAIAPGRYTVYWRIMSADGHAVTGDSVVRVGAVNAPPAAAANAAFGSGHGAWIAAIGRTLVIAGAVVALGLVALRWVIADPAAAGGDCARPVQRATSMRAAGCWGRSPYRCRHGGAAGHSR
ncbi:MAG: copper resistance protein CopC [Thermoleophilia bacterium]